MQIIITDGTLFTPTLKTQRYEETARLAFDISHDTTIAELTELIDRERPLAPGRVIPLTPGPTPSPSRPCDVARTRDRWRLDSEALLPCALLTDEVRPRGRLAGGLASERYGKALRGPPGHGRLLCLGGAPAGPAAAGPAGDRRRARAAGGRHHRLL